MGTKVKPIPEGYQAVTPYMSVKWAASAIEFYKKAFGAKEVMRMPGSGGTIGHAEIQFGKSRIMLADEYPEMNFRSPQSFEGSPVHILYVKDADGVALSLLLFANNVAIKLLEGLVELRYALQRRTTHPTADARPQRSADKRSGTGR